MTLVDQDNRTSESIARVAVRRAVQCLFVVALLAWSGLLAPVAPFSGDLHLWDEAHYQTGGARILDEGPAAALRVWSPIYSLVTALLVGLFGPVGVSSFLSVLCSVISTGMSFLAVRAISSTNAGLVVAAWWAATMPSQLVGGVFLKPMVYVFGSCLLWMCVWLVARKRYVASLVPYALAAVDRPELGAVGLLAVGAVVVHRAFRGYLGRTAGRSGAQERWPRTPWLGFVSVSLATTIYALATPVLRERTWFAFEQHYALGEAERGEGDAMNFMLPRRHVEKDFPASKSLGQAALENPRALFRHLTSNVPHFAEPATEVVMAASRGHFALGVAFWGSALCLVLIGAVSRRRCARLPPILFFIAVGAAMVGLLLRPRWELLLPTIVVIALWAGGMGAAGSNWLVSRGRAGRIAAWAIGSLMLWALVAGSRCEGPPDVDRGFATGAIEVLREIGGPAGVWGPGAPGLITYTGRHDLRGLDMLTDRAIGMAGDDTSVADRVRGFGVDYILVTPEVLAVAWLRSAIIELAYSGGWQIAELAPSLLVFSRGGAVLPPPTWAPRTPSHSIDQTAGAVLATAGTSEARRWLATLGRLRAVGPSTVKQVLAMTTNAELGDLALWAAVRSGVALELLEPVLVAASTDTAARTRGAAAWGLGHLPGSSERAARIDTLCLDPDPNVKMAAAAARQRLATPRR